MNRKQKKNLIRIIIAAVLLILACQSPGMAQRGTVSRGIYSHRL